MKTLNITIRYISDIAKFTQEAMKVTGDVSIYKDKYVIDGKSIMGLFSINTSDITVEYPKEAIEFEKFLLDTFVNN